MFQRIDRPQKMVRNKRTNNLNCLLFAINWLLLCAGQLTSIVNANIVKTDVNRIVDGRLSTTNRTNSTTNVTLSFFSNEQTPISKGQILLSTSPPSNKVNSTSTRIDSDSLIKQTVTSSNDLNNLDGLAHSPPHNRHATNQTVNRRSDNFIPNSKHQQQSDQIEQIDRKFAKRSAQFSRTRRRSLSDQLDEQVYKFHRQRRSINMAYSPKMYEMLLKSKRSSDGVESITLGAILPKTALITKFRSYQKRLQDAVEDLMDAKNGVFHFLQRFRIAQAQLVLLSRNPTPTEILSALCDKLLPYNVSTLIYMSNSDTDDNDAASALYLMQLTSYLGIPGRFIGDLSIF